MQFSWEKPESTLDFAVIGDSFDKLLRATENKVEREWPIPLGGVGAHAVPFLFALNTARWTYVATRYLLADKPEDQRRHLEFAVAAPPLTRTLLDLVFNLVFIFDDYHERLCWYLASGLNEVEKMIARFRNTYAGSPAWDPWLAQFAHINAPFAETRDRVCSGKQPPKNRFPHPGLILKQKFRCADSLKFLNYLNDWFYRDLSSSSHGHWMGLSTRAAQVLRIQAKDDVQLKYAQKYKSDCLVEQVAVMLCLVSEIIAAAQFDNKPQANYIWAILAAYSLMTKELHEMRYQRLLS
jgi:hypothetical protein